MNLNASRVKAEILRIGVLIQLRKKSLPDTILPPLGEAGINALPGTVALRKLSLLRPAVIHPKHTVEHDSVVFSGASFLPRVFWWEQRLNTLPLLLCEIVVDIVIHALIIPFSPLLCKIYFSNRA